MAPAAAASLMIFSAFACVNRAPQAAVNGVWVKVVAPWAVDSSRWSEAWLTRTHQVFLWVACDLKLRCSYFDYARHGCASAFSEQNAEALCVECKLLKLQRFKQRSRCRAMRDRKIKQWMQLSRLINRVCVSLCLGSRQYGRTAGSCPMSSHRVR